MEYKVLVHKENGYYRATVLNKPNLSEVAPSENEVIEQIGAAIRSGEVTSKIISMDGNGKVIETSTSNSILQVAGINRDDPNFAQYQHDIAKYRAEIDAHLAG